MSLHRAEPRTTFLLTPLREGRPALDSSASSLRSISTHAPAGGATRAAGFIRSRHGVISTHAPAGGATSRSGRSCRSRSAFLLTPLREGRHGGKALKDSGIVDISTHAPAGGATDRNAERRCAGDNFYSRPCGRGDVGLGQHFDSVGIDFYSRPCGRGDSNFPQVRHEVLRQIAER